MSNLKRHGRLRWSPSYLRNRGHLTRGHRRALREWWPRYGIRFEHGRIIDLGTHFRGMEGPLVLEIGFGMGEHLVHLGRAVPDHRILGIEVHRPGLASAVRKIHEAGLENVRVVRGDARLVLTDHLEDQVARAVIVQFPDPWPKPGDEHRRLIQTDFLATLARRVEPGGELLVSTDVPDYAAHCRRIVRESESWEEVPTSDWIAHRIVTPYEARARNEGRGIVDLCFRATS